jgi:hypothetical protein
MSSCVEEFLRRCSSNDKRSQNISRKGLSMIEVHSKRNSSIKHKDYSRDFSIFKTSSLGFS